MAIIDVQYQRTLRHEQEVLRSRFVSGVLQDTPSALFLASKERRTGTEHGARVEKPTDGKADSALMMISKHLNLHMLYQQVVSDAKWGPGERICSP